MQAALKTLESAGCITVQRSGRNGSFLTHVDYRSLLDYANISRVVCAMPLPYTREYEGLASGLKREFSDVPFYFAHMRERIFAWNVCAMAFMTWRSSRAWPLKNMQAGRKTG